MKDKIRVIIADDHPFELLGLADLLSFSDEVDVIAKVDTAQEAVGKTQELKPDVIMLDMFWYRNEQEGLAAIRQIREIAPETRILAMTAYDKMIDKARDAGADRAMHKDSFISKEVIVKHIRATYESRRLLSIQQSPYEKLSKREQEALQLICEGLSDKEIATRLGIMPNTVKKFNANVYKKLGVVGRTEAVAFALRHGMVTPSETKE